jgi:hypothetical protein
MTFPEVDPNIELFIVPFAENFSTHVQEDNCQRYD